MHTESDDLARYQQQMVLPGFGQEAQIKLRNASVLVIGAGGLGAPMLKYLTAAGVGRIGIVDPDVVSLTNLHRQVLYGETALGLPKAQVAIQRLRDLNSQVIFKSLVQRLNRTNAFELIGKYDIIADGSDNFATRYLVNDVSVALGKPLVYGSVYQYEGQASVFNFPTGVGPNYRCLHPTPPAAEDVPNCGEGGVLGTLPGMVGMVMAQEVIKLITGIGQTLAGRLWVYDALQVKTTVLDLARDPTNILFKPDFDWGQIKYGDAGSDIPLGLAAETLVHQLHTDVKPLLIDVREPWEHTEYDPLGGINVPYTTIETVTAQVEASKVPVVLYCRTGGRSLAAAKRLRTLTGHVNIQSLIGGVEALRDQPTIV